MIDPLVVYVTGVVVLLVLTCSVAGLLDLFDWEHDSGVVMAFIC